MRTKAGRLACCCLPLFLAAGLWANGEPGLVDAVKNQDRQAVQVLLRQHADVNSPAPDGATALHWAVHWNDLETARMLIRAGAKVNARNELGITPLILACSNGSGSMIEALLNWGADSNGAAPNGESPLMIAARTADVDAIKALLARGANVNAREKLRGQTALMWAVAERRPEIVRVLIEHGADVNARSLISHEMIYRDNPDPGDEIAAKGQPRPVGENLPRGGSTPFLFAARQGDIDCARLLLAAGANVNDAAPDGTSALVMAAYSDHGAFATFLLDHGADPNASDAGYTALHIAVLTRDTELVKALLAHGANANARLTKGTPVRRFEEDLVIPQSIAGATPFLLAARLSEVDLMHTLAAAGADPRIPADNGTTPLMAAVVPDRRSLALRGLRSAQVVSRTVEAVQLALQLGNDINATDSEGNTALHMAASKGANAIVQLLVDKGANLQARNKLRQTPLNLTENPLLSVSARPRLKTTAELLRKLGAHE